MIFDINEENLDSLAITACPDDFWANDNCMLLDDELYIDKYNCSCAATCSACWLKYMSKESEGNYEK